MNDKVLIYDSGTQYYVDAKDIYDPFPDDDETPETEEEDADDETHSDDWGNDNEEED